MSRKAPPIDPTSADNGCVRVRGAREHNLQNVDIDIPRDALVVFTGVSGSGKSSLAFGTIYAEAQRRYFESVAPYARRLIEQAGVPRCGWDRRTAAGGRVATESWGEQRSLLCGQSQHDYRPRWTARRSTGSV
jgi:hypothetical protein